MFALIGALRRNSVEKNRRLSMKQKKWLIAALTGAMSVTTLLAIVACKDGATSTDDSSSSSSSPTEPTEGPETGVYYYDAADDEYQIALNGGDRFTFLVMDENASGTYTLTDDTLVLNFSRSAMEPITAVYADNVITFTYENSEMRFLKKIDYTITFDSNEGSAVEAVEVVNGRTANKPADPVRQGYKFIGWYTDEEFTDPFLFGTEPVMSDMTLYAYWSQNKVGTSEFMVDFDLGYDAEAPASVETINSCVYMLPEPDRDGYTFEGWWVSAYDDAEKLTYRFENGMQLTEDTTLYAVWSDKAAEATAPLVSVDANNVRWTAVRGAIVYAVTVKTSDGQVIVDNAKTDTLSYAFDFSAQAAGDYIVSVQASAVNNVTEDPAATTVCYYRNKALARVSNISVVEPSALVFEGVENAQRYYITIDCGDDNHEHTMVALGNSTNYNFSGCSMQQGGIRFVITAEADGWSSSVSREFVYNRELAAIDEFEFDEETQTLHWNPVADAVSYVVSVSCGDSSHSHEEVDIGSSTSYCIKECGAGQIVVNVYPKTKGWNSPVAAQWTYEKTAPGTPYNVRTVGNYIYWNAVSGATSYTVEINGTEYTVETNAFDLSANLDAGAGVNDYTVRIRANGTESSLWSDAVGMHYLAMAGSLSYDQGILSWDGVWGATYYEIQVNDGEVMRVDSDCNSSAIKLTKSGKNTVRVRFGNSVDPVSGWIETSVYAYEVVLDTRGGAGVETVYKAYGDPIGLPEQIDRAGYDFAGWYNVPGGAASGGAKYDETLFNERNDIILYAYWTPRTYQVSLNADGGVIEQQSAALVYGKEFSLEVPKNGTGRDERFAFKGYYSEPNGRGVRYTDSEGNSVTPWAIAEEGATLYACWREVFSFVETIAADGSTSYAVEQGPQINELNAVRVPVSYNNIRVTTIYSGAFLDCTSLERIDIPNTIELIGSVSTSDTTGAFAGCSNLQNVNVYAVEGTHEVKYTSVEGVLIDNNSANGLVRIAYFPAARTGVYRIPAGVQEIPVRTFSGSDISSVTIPSTVNYIRQSAFYGCENLKEIIFETALSDDGSAELVIEDLAFQNCKALEIIVLPKRVGEFESVSEAFYGCSLLANIEVEEGNAYYSSVDGMLCDAEGKTILYCPINRGGDYTIPAGITAIADEAFMDRDEFTSITFNPYVETIGMNAFANCMNLQKIVFQSAVVQGNGKTIGDRAFYNCKALTTVEFQENCGVAKIGNYAFASCTVLSELTIPATIEALGSYAFQNCANLATVSFAGGGSDVEFGEYVFSECSALARVELSASVGVFDVMSVFSGCDNLASVVVDPGNPNYTDKEGVLYDKEVTQLVFYPKQISVTQVTLPETVTTIGAHVFENNTIIQSITIGKNVTTIGDNAFNGCTGLQSVVFEEGGTETLTLGEYAFSGCANVASIVLPERLTELSAYAFYLNGGLSSVTFGSQLTKIGAYALAGTGLPEIIIPGSVQTVEAYAFDNCSALVKAEFPASMKTIGSSIFSNCNRLSEVVIPEGVEEIGDFAFEWCVALEEIQLPVSLKTIGNFAFAGCTALESIVIPQGVESIGGGAFSECTALSRVTFEEGGEAGLRLETIPDDLALNGHMDSEGVFYQCTALTSITLPVRIAYIGQWCFYNCSNLTSVVFETDESGTSRLETIDELAFVSLHLTELTLPEGLKTIERRAFAITGTGAALEELVIPSTVTTVGEQAFDMQKALKSVVFREGTEELTIVDEAFSDCTALETVVLPSNLVSLAEDAFVGCISVTAYSFSGENTNFVTEGGALYNAEKTKLLAFPIGLTGSISLPEGLTELSANALEGAKATEIILPSTLVSIGNYALSETAITSIVIPKSVTTMGSNVFRDCADLVSVEFETGSLLTEMGTYTFSGTAIEQITLPGNVTSVGNYSFRNCKELVSVTLPKSITTFGSNMFYGCSKLTTVTFEEGWTAEAFSSSNFRECTSLTSITIPAGTKTIGTYAFQDSGLTSIIIPNSVTKIDNNAFRNCDALSSVVFESGGKETLTIVNGSTSTSTASTSAGAFRGCTGLESIVLPARIGVLGSYAFADCTNLAEITFEDGCGLAEIGNLAFWNCAISEFVVPSTVTKLGTATVTTTTMAPFKNCENLKSVTLPDNWEIMRNRFNGCEALEEVLVTDNNSRYISVDGVILSLDGTELVYFPAGKAVGETYTIPETVQRIGDYAFFHTRVTSSTNYIADYAKFTEVVLPAELTEIGTYAFEYCEDLVKVTFAGNGKLTTIGNYAFAYSGLESVLIPSTVTTIGNNAFYTCKSLETVNFETNSNLTTIGNSAFRSIPVTSITFPDSVTSVGTYVLAGCTALTEFTVPAGLTSVGNYMFQGCTALRSVTLPDSVTAIGTYAFQNCSAMTEFVIPAEVTSVGMYAFSGCSNLVSVTLESGSRLKTFGNYTFQNCKALEQVELPMTLEEIPDYMFTGCTSLTTVEIPNTVSDIGRNAFYGCTSLQDITIPGNVISIGQSAFEGCENLSSVELIRGITSIGAAAFRDCAQLTDIRIVSTITEIGDNAFSGCTQINYTVEPESSSYLTDEQGVLYDSKMQTLLAVPAVMTGEYVVPDSVTVITPGVFQNSLVSKVTLPESITEISEEMFANTPNLTEVEMLGRITYIGKSAFAGSAIQKITIGKYVTKIDESAFDGCTNLQEVTFEKGGNSGLQLIKYAFRGCTSLKSIELPRRVRNVETYNSYGYVSSVTAGVGESCFEGCTLLSSVTFEQTGAWLLKEALSLGKSAFKNCTSLTAISLPSYVYTRAVASSYSTTYYYGLSDYCFSGCTALSSVVFEGYDQSTSYYIGAYVFENCTALKSIEIPSTLYMVSNTKGLFSGCTALEEAVFSGNGWSYSTDQLIFKGCSALKKVTITGGISGAIGMNAFVDCPELETVQITGEINYIGKNAFKGCTKLQSFEVPETCTTIYDNAFEGCTGLTELTLGASLKTINAEAFKDCSGLQTVTISRYVATIGEGVFDGCTALIAIEVAEGNLTYKSVDGNLYSADGTQLIRYAAGKTAESFVVPEGVTTISAGAFKDCTALKSVTIPESVTTIEAGAFAGWTAEQSISVVFADASQTPAGWESGWSADAVINYTTSGSSDTEETVGEGTEGDVVENV